MGPADYHIARRTPTPLGTAGPRRQSLSGNGPPCPNLDGLDAFRLTTPPNPAERPRPPLALRWAANQDGLEARPERAGGVGPSGLTGPKYRGFVGSVQSSSRSSTRAPEPGSGHRRARLLALTAGVTFLCVTAAHADTLDPRTRALELIRSLESGATEKSPTREPVLRAKAALERADSQRQQGDEAHARLLEDFALEWAETGGDLVEVSALEEQARALEEKLLQAETKVRRARTLLEETETRRGRARTELQHLEGAAAGSSNPTPATAPSAKESPTPATSAPATSTPSKAAPQPSAPPAKPPGGAP